MCVRHFPRVGRKRTRETGLARLAESDARGYYHICDLLLDSLVSN
jgi:hypothetical protein